MDNKVNTNRIAEKAGVPCVPNVLSEVKDYDNGHIQFDGMDTHRRAVESEKEAFFLRITRANDYLYEGADMGILVSRGRMMTNDFELTERAKNWIKAIRSKYSSQLIEDKREQPVLIGSLTK